VLLVVDGVGAGTVGIGTGGVFCGSCDPSFVPSATPLDGDGFEEGVGCAGDEDAGDLDGGVWMFGLEILDWLFWPLKQAVSKFGMLVLLFLLRSRLKT